MVLHVAPVLCGVCVQDRGMFMCFTPYLRMPTLRWRCGMGGAETAEALCSAPEHLGGNHSQSPHDNRIAHGFDEPGLRARLLFHHVRVLPPGIIGDPCVLVWSHLIGAQRGQSELALQRAQVHTTPL